MNLIQKKLRDLETDIREAQHRLESLDAEYRHLKRLAEQPCWVSFTGATTLISNMDDQHLLNSIRVCLRMDKRYAYDAARMESFACMILEAQRRGIADEIDGRVR